MSGTPYQLHHGGLVICHTYTLHLGILCSLYFSMLPFVCSTNQLQLTSSQTPILYLCIVYHALLSALHSPASSHHPSLRYRLASPSLQQLTIIRYFVSRLVATPRISPHQPAKGSIASAQIPHLIRPGLPLFHHSLHYYRCDLPNQSAWPRANTDQPRIIPPSSFPLPDAACLARII
ncbi:hypothetical protein M431DRAFT_421770 [Trichoderma harzianum CBS 226.95]|uniref:Uncharacterized protein n=1 Tax=Trichoderma harzianum CBS 226.95 TaxID=983964 RepID=A0A2T4AC12_TRIHA|nr:hypothetical protein M431DRAFT_421770 [Trichoderma harzianum CBS 226.95]PTB54478.1 hypothetical protein M431DRAFT_421770 [Trichoderma harzianum CBS 226.95]